MKHNITIVDNKVAGSHIMTTEELKAYFKLHDKGFLTATESFQVPKHNVNIKYATSLTYQAHVKTSPIFSPSSRLERTLTEYFDELLEENN